MTTLTPRCTTCRIKNLSLLRHCSNELLEELSAKKSSHCLKKGDRLLTADEEAKSVYCIRSGVARVEIQDKDGHALILRLESEGAILGHRAARKKDRQSLSISAVENMQVCRFSAEQFRSLSMKCPGLRSEIMKSLMSELNRAESLALSLARHSVRERIAAALLHIAAVYRYRQGGCSIQVHLDRQDMADLAGTTKEQVSAILAELRRAGLVNFKAKYFKYFDLAGLAKMAGVTGI